MSWDYLGNHRVYCADCLIDEKFFAGWVAIPSFTNKVETLFDQNHKKIVSIIIPKELRSVGALQVFFHPSERIEFDIDDEFI